MADSTMPRGRCRRASGSGPGERPLLESAAQDRETPRQGTHALARLSSRRPRSVPLPLTPQSEQRVIDAEFVQASAWAQHMAFDRKSAPRPVAAGPTARADLDRPMRSSRARAMDSLDIDRVRAPPNASSEGAGGSFTILQGLSNLAAQIMVKSGFRPRACLRSA